MSVFLKHFCIKLISIMSIFITWFLSAYEELNLFSDFFNYFVAFFEQSGYKEFMSIIRPLKVRADNLTNILVHFKNGAKCSLFFGYGSHAVPLDFDASKNENFWQLEQNYYPAFFEAKRIQGTLDDNNLNLCNIPCYNGFIVVPSTTIFNHLNEGVGFSTVEIMYVSHHSDIFRNKFEDAASEIFCIEFMDKEEVDYYLNNIDGAKAACPKHIIERMVAETYGADTYFYLNKKERLTKNLKIKKLRTKLKMLLETNSKYNYEEAIICYSAIKCFDKLELSKNIFNSIIER